MKVLKILLLVKVSKKFNFWKIIRTLTPPLPPIEVWDVSEKPISRIQTSGCAREEVDQIPIPDIGPRCEEIGLWCSICNLNRSGKSNTSKHSETRITSLTSRFLERAITFPHNRFLKNFVAMRHSEKCQNWAHSVLFFYVVLMSENIGFKAFYRFHGVLTQR